MSNISIKLKSGETRRFEHTGRAGGSYTKTVRFESGWVIVEDEWGTRTAFPSDDVAEVEERDHRGGW